jgi:DNA-binding NtrC family response regulator
MWQDASGFNSRPLPMATGLNQKQKDQSERELIYRALLELRNELAEVKDMLRQLTNGRETPNRLALPARSSEIQTGDTLTLEEIEQRAMRETLERFHGNRRQAAEALGISERTLYRKMKESGDGDTGQYED